MAFTVKSYDSELLAPFSSVTSVKTRDRSSVEDYDGTLGSIANCIEQLRQNTSVQSQLSALRQLLELINSRKDACSAMIAHSQALPTLISLLRKGSNEVKTHVATILGTTCKEEELRVKILLGGCVTPLLDLLKSSTKDGQLAAAEAIYSLSQGRSKDNISSTIFITTQGVVPTLWQQLKNGSKLVNSVDGLLTGTLRNLCGSSDGFWHATIGAEGINILANLIKHGNPVTQANACFILENMIEVQERVYPEVLKAGIIEKLLKLIGKGNQVMVRAGAASAIKALSAYSKDAIRDVTQADGVPRLMNATIAPSKEFMHGEYAQRLQENAMLAMANVSGGFSKVIDILCDTFKACKSEDQASDQIGAIASALMLYDCNSEIKKAADATKLEKALLTEMKPGSSFLLQERIIEALGSLYSNSYLSSKLHYGEAKRLLITLITMAPDEVQNELISYLKTLCNNTSSLLDAVEGRKGIHLFISLLGLSSEQQQECAVALLCVLVNENDESKWFITSEGGIPQLVQVLDMGSSKAREDAATLLGELCNYNEDIRRCIQSADAVPSLLWLFKNGSPSGKEIAAKTLKLLVRHSDSSTISHLTALLTSDLPESKGHVLDALKYILSVTSSREILLHGSASNAAIEIIVKGLASSEEDTIANSAAVLAFLFNCHKDLRESIVAIRSMGLLKSLLVTSSDNIRANAAGCLAAIFKSIKKVQEIATVAKEVLPQLINYVKSSNIAVAEQGTRALSNALLDNNISKIFSIDGIVSPITRVLREGASDARTEAAAVVTRFLEAREANESLCELLNHEETVMVLVSLLEAAKVEDDATCQVLHALALIARIKIGVRKSQPPLIVLNQVPESLGPLVSCLAARSSTLQERAIEVLSRLCRHRPIVLGEMIASSPAGLIAIAEQVRISEKYEVRVGGIGLLICAAKEHNTQTMQILYEHVLSGESKDASLCVELIGTLVKRIEFESAPWFSERECRVTEGGCDDVTNSENCVATMLDGRVSVWLLSLIASYDNYSKRTIMKAGAIQILIERISKFSSNSLQVSSEDDTWVFALLLAILCKDNEVCHAKITMQTLPVVAALLQSKYMANKFFAAQAIASIVCNSPRDRVLAVANSGAIGGLIEVLGYSQSHILNEIAYANVFSLPQNPELIALQSLFKVDEIRFGAISSKAIPPLVDLINPIQDRPNATSWAIRLLTQLVMDNDSKKCVMTEAGAIDALTRYLSLGIRNAVEEDVTDLLIILFSNSELCRHDSAKLMVKHLVTVLCEGTQVSRYKATRALEGLFGSESNRVGEDARQAVQPLVELVGSGSEKEKGAAIGALTKLFENPSNLFAVTSGETNAVDVLNNIFCSNCSVQLKEDAAELCCVLFRSIKARASPAAVRCLESLLSVIKSNHLSQARYAAVRAVDNLLDDQHIADSVAKPDVVKMFIGLLDDRNSLLHEEVFICLSKLAKDRNDCKLDMIKAGVIENILQIIKGAPDVLCACIAEFLRVLTINRNITKNPAVARVVKPLFSALTRPFLSFGGQCSALQVLINILEDPQRRASYNLTPSQALQPLILFLSSQSQQLQDLTADLLSHLLMENDLQRSTTAEEAVRPLLDIIGSGVPALQNKAIKVLQMVSSSFPEAIALAGGAVELSKVILQAQPVAPHVVWESAASMLSSILECSSMHYSQIPVGALVRMLRSESETTVVAALQVLLVLQSEDASSIVKMCENGAIEALLEILRCHQCDEAAARLLEALVSNSIIRETRVVKAAISPLSQYLADPETLNKESKFLAALALGDIFQNTALAKTTDAISASRALLSLLEDRPTEKMCLVAICALQSIMHNNLCRKAVAEAGGIQKVVKLVNLGICSERETETQAAILIRLLLPKNPTQEFGWTEILQSLTGMIQKDLDTRGTANDEYLKALNALFNNYPRLKSKEDSTQCIPLLVAALKAGPEASREAALDSIYLLKEGWANSPSEVSRAQAILASQAIPILQQLIESGLTRTQDKAEQLLQLLPGILLVSVKRGFNLKQKAHPTLYCKISPGDYPPKKTKAVVTGSNPEFDKVLSWDFDKPPRDLKLHISCKGRSALGKYSLGKVTIKLDPIIMLGAMSDVYNLQPEKIKAGQPRSLEVEIKWTNQRD